MLPCTYDLGLIYCWVGALGAGNKEQKFAFTYIFVITYFEYPIRISLISKEIVILKLEKLARLSDETYPIMFS